MRDVLWSAGSEQRLQDRVGEHAAVEDVDEPVQRGLATGVVVETRHDYIVTQVGVLDLLGSGLAVLDDEGGERPAR